MEDTADEEAAGGRGKKKPDGKPKTKDITRFLATAAAMAGDDVDDAMIVGAGGQAVTRKSESDDVSAPWRRAMGGSRSPLRPPLTLARPTAARAHAPHPPPPLQVLTREKLKRNVKVATAAQQQGVDAAAPSAKR